MSKKTETKASDHDSYGTFTIIALILPIIGMVLGTVYLTKEEDADKKVGEHMIAVSILSTIAWSLMYFGFVNYYYSDFILG